MNNIVKVGLEKYIKSDDGRKEAIAYLELSKPSTQHVMNQGTKTPLGCTCFLDLLRH